MPPQTQPGHRLRYQAQTETPGPGARKLAPVGLRLQWWVRPVAPVGRLSSLFGGLPAQLITEASGLRPAPPSHCSALSLSPGIPTGGAGAGAGETPPPATAPKSRLQNQRRSSYSVASCGAPSWRFLVCCRFAESQRPSGDGHPFCGRKCKKGAHPPSLGAPAPPLVPRSPGRPRLQGDTVKTPADPSANQLPPPPPPPCRAPGASACPRPAVRPPSLAAGRPGGSFTTTTTKSSATLRGALRGPPGPPPAVVSVRLFSSSIRHVCRGGGVGRGSAPVTASRGSATPPPPHPCAAIAETLFGTYAGDARCARLAPAPAPPVGIPFRSDSKTAPPLLVYLAVGGRGGAPPRTPYVIQRSLFPIGAEGAGASPSSRRGAGRRAAACRGCLRQTTENPAVDNLSTLCGQTARCARLPHKRCG